ncbi:MAG: hypothetical protein N4A46_01430, partial [Schleiferiaceae bacterium]|nr:hypothetical protein [Schleiferiaceae bacterium]
SGKDYYGYPDHQCIAFYNLKDFTDQPFRVARFPKNEVPIFRFKFYFNQTHLLVSQKCEFSIYEFRKGNELEKLDSVDVCNETKIDGNITSMKIYKSQMLIGFHEAMYYFWGYQPVGDLEDGEAVIGKTIWNEKTGKQESYVLSNEPELLAKYGVEQDFFQEHSRVYESYQSRVKRYAGAGIVRIYEIEGKDLKLKQHLVPSIRHAEDWFGARMAVSNDHLLISALGYPDKTKNHEEYKHRFSGAVFQFSLDADGQWQESGLYRSVHQKRWDKFGFSLNAWNNLFFIGSRFDDYEAERDRDEGAVYLLKLE